MAKCKQFTKKLLVILLSVLLVTNNIQVFAEDNTFHKDGTEYLSLPNTPYATYEQKQILQQQIKWINLSDRDLVEIENTKNNDGVTMQIGTTITVYPMTRAGESRNEDYKVVFTVAELKPFNASDEYKNRSNDYDPDNILTTPADYNPNAQNNKDVFIGRINRWSNLAHSGIGVPIGDLGAITAPTRVNVGVTFDVAAEYLDKQSQRWIKAYPNIVVADGEEANNGEFVAFATRRMENGKNVATWELLANINDVDINGNAKKTELINVMTAADKNGNYPSDYDSNHNSVFTGPQLSAEARRSWVNPDIVNGGIGTSVFGPVRTAFRSYVDYGRGPHAGVPILLTRAPEQISVYINDHGAQNMMLGVMQIDEGDAPTTFGGASHSILQNDTTTHPYLGEVAPDYEIHNHNEQITAWLTDDENNYQDEGEAQLMGQGKKYPTFVSGQDFNLNVLANNNSGEQVSYAKAFVDFNNDGSFDPLKEASATVKLSGREQQSITLQFKDTAQLSYQQYLANNQARGINSSQDKIGARIRIARSKDDVLNPVGVASSGEVEDFLLPIQFPPIGKKIQTQGAIGETQYSDNKQLKDGVYDGNDGILASTFGTDTPTISKIRIVNPDPNATDVQLSEYTERAANGDIVGVYRVDGDKIKFTPSKTFVGKAKGVIVRITDSNQNSTAWTNKDSSANVNQRPVNNGMDDEAVKTMDSVYIPVVVEILAVNDQTKDIQGRNQSGKIVFKSSDNDFKLEGSFIYQSKDGNDYLPQAEADILPAYDLEGNKIGSYQLGDITDSIKIDSGDSKEQAINFIPYKEFSGKVQPLKIKFVNPQGLSVEAEYTPEVTPVTPIGASLLSSNYKNETQEEALIFATGHPDIKIERSDNNPYQFVKYDTEGNVTPIQITTMPAIAIDGSSAGEFVIDQDKGSVKFIPKKEFVGKVQAVNIGLKDENDTWAVNDYTPKVLASDIIPQDIVSINAQGKEQSSKIIFTDRAGDAVKGGTIQLVDSEGKALDVERDSSDKTDNYIDEFGNKYSLDVANGTITFQPAKEYTGKKSKIGIKLTTTIGGKLDTAIAEYYPTVIPVKPSGHNIKTLGNINEKQDTSEDIHEPKQVLFEAGTVQISSGSAVTIPLKEDSLVIIDPDDGSEVKQLTVKDPAGIEIGEYKVVGDQVEFMPVKDFEGDAPPVTLQISDENGEKATAVYSPSVVDLNPKMKIPVKVVFEANQSGQTVPPNLQTGIITVELDNGDVISLDANDDWQSVFEDLTIPAADKPYTIKKVSYQINGKTYNDDDTGNPKLTISFDDSDMSKGFTITIKAKQHITIPVKTVFTENVPNRLKDGIMQVTLSNDDQLELYPQNDFQASFDNLTKYDDAMQIVDYQIKDKIYTVDGVTNPERTSYSISGNQNEGFTITVDYEKLPAVVEEKPKIETIDIPVKTTFEAGTEPKYKKGLFTITLNDGTSISTEALSDFKDIFKELAKNDHNGKLIDYQIKDISYQIDEEKVANADISWTGNMNSGFEIMVAIKAETEQTKAPKTTTEAGNNNSRPAPAVAEKSDETEPTTEKSEPEIERPVLKSEQTETKPAKNETTDNSTKAIQKPTTTEPSEVIVKTVPEKTETSVLATTKKIVNPQTLPLNKGKIFTLVDKNNNKIATIKVEADGSYTIIEDDVVALGKVRINDAGKVEMVDLNIPLANNGSALPKTNEESKILYQLSGLLTIIAALFLLFNKDN